MEFQMTKGIKIAGRAIEILHVEDSVGDANLLKQVLKKAGFPNKLNSVTDGEQALQFLKKEQKYSTAPRPDVILLDLKLPGKDGLTVLNEIHQNDSFAHIPIIILTGSESELDMNWASRLNVSHYIVKPFELTGFDELIKLLRAIWMKTFRKHA
jgi:two-component system, chemotaxis family, response regulator Rcp1